MTTEVCNALAQSINNYMSRQLTHISTSVTRTARQVHSCERTNRCPINRCFDEVRVGRFHLRAETTWSEHTMRRAVTAQVAGLHTGFSSRWPLEHDSLVSRGSLRQCNMALTSPKGEGCRCLDGTEEHLFRNPSPIRYNFAREQNVRDHFRWP